MSYRIVENFPDTPHGGLERPEPLWIVNVLVVGIIGLTVLTFGVLFTSMALTAIDPWSLAGLGLVGAWMCLLALPLLAVPRTGPDRIVFDRTQRQIVVLEHAGDDPSQAATLSYDGIQDLVVRRHTEVVNKVPTTYWSLHLLQTDASDWEIVRLDKLEEAEARREALLDIMGWSAEDRPTSAEGFTGHAGWSAAGAPVASRSSRFDIQEDTHSTTIRWTRPRPMRRDYALRVLMLGCAFLAIGGASAQGLGYIVASVALLVGGLIMVGRWNSRNRGFVVISEHALETDPLWSLLPATAQSHRIPSADLISIGFDLHRPWRLTLLDKQQHQQVMKLVTGALPPGQADEASAERTPASSGSSAPSAPWAMQTSFIDSSWLDFADVLRLEALIEEAFERHTGRQLL